MISPVIQEFYKDFSEWVYEHDTASLVLGSVLTGGTMAISALSSDDMPQDDGNLSLNHFDEICAVFFDGDTPKAAGLAFHSQNQHGYCMAIGVTALRSTVASLRPYYPLPNGALCYFRATIPPTDSSPIWDMLPVVRKYVTLQG